LQGANHLLRQRRRDAKRIGDLARLEFLETDRRFHGGADNRLRARGRDFLDLHPAFGRGDDHHPLRGTVEDEAEVDFAIEVNGGLDIDAIDPLAFRPGLVRHDLAAEHRVGRFMDLVLGVAELDAPRLAAAPGMDLGLDDPAVAPQFARPVGGLFGAVGQRARRHGDTEFCKDFLGLVLVDVHLIPPLFSGHGGGVVAFQRLQRRGQIDIRAHRVHLGGKAAYDLGDRSL
jgi:hypothetical protein